MKTDEEIRNEVIIALKAESILNLTILNVVVKDGIVTLRGTVNSSSKKISAWHAACSIKGVRAVELSIIILPAMNSGKEDGIKRFF
jgi:osmotically-inducible protein OsmY